MRPALVTLVPMLAAAGLVLIGGERLARQEVEKRTPADRERLMEFANSFDAELERLEALYGAHLDRLAEAFGTEADSEVEEAAREITTIHAMHLLTLGSSRKELPLAPPGANTPRLPEIVLEERDTPLNPNNAVVVPPELLDWALGGKSGVLPAPDPRHQILWTRPDQLRLVAFVIDREELRARTDEHLTTWMGGPLTPLREAGERFAIRSASGGDLATDGTADRGPAALVIPFRTRLGDWQIHAWDGVSVSIRHDTAALTTAGTVAAILAIGGLFLYIQQRRALQLAEERVSFVNRVSHELGTPLTNVALNLDLATEALEAQPPEARRRLDIATEEIERLARLVANVLTFSRRERRTLELDPQPCTPDEVIGKTLASFRPALRRREIDIDWTAEAPDRVRLDPDALGQIVGNLISNVEKYAAAGHWLGMHSTLTDGTLTVRISDHGPGIPASGRERVFQPFERVHREVNEGSSGTGLGLTIARELATRMGGSLELAESTGGSRFELRLPAPGVLAVVPDDESSAA